MKEKVHKQFTITNINHKLFEEDVNKYLTVGWDILDGSYSKESKNGDTIYSQILVWRDAADSEIEFENNYPIKKTESIKGNKVRITKWFGNLSMGEGGKISLIKEGFNNENTQRKASGLKILMAIISKKMESIYVTMIMEILITTFIIKQEN